MAHGGTFDPVFQIRSFREGDEPEVCRVVKSVYDEYRFTWDPEGYHADLHDLAEHYGGQNSSFWVAESGSVVLGCIGLEVFEPLPGVGPFEFEGSVRLGGCDCSMERLYVHPEARRQGVGRALALTCIEAARTRKCRQMEIWSDKRFVDAHRLYQALGATVMADRICDDPDVSPEWGLVLLL